MLAVAVVGLAANGVSLYLLRDAQGHSLNMRGAYLEVMGDLLGSVAVIVAAVVIAATGWTQADALASVATRWSIASTITRQARARRSAWSGAPAGGAASL